MHKLKKIVPQSIKNIYHLAQAILANIMYGFPSRKLKVIGITGTNGKTTTAQMVSKILEEAGNPVKPGSHGARKVAMISTINFKIGEKEWVNKTKFTTLSPFATQKFIRQAAGAGCEYLVLETSSHSLDQYRVWGIRYQTAVMTNVTREHLDYHQTMEDYRKAKEKLFFLAAKNGGTAIVNLDMENPGEYLNVESPIKIGYSTKFPISNFQFPNKSQFPISNFQTVVAEDIELGINYSKFKIFAPSLSLGKNYKFVLNIPGGFNVENALAAICVGLSEKISLEVMGKALEKIKNVPGRLEFVPNSRGLNIIIDYAVTPDSLEKLYALIRQINTEKKKVIAVFGSCGERDRGKRPIMGAIVSKYADYVFVTNEDPYGENPDSIIEEVAAGVRGRIPGENFWKISDRREAISSALKLADAGDFVVVTGKGAEETMAVGNKRIPWNDKQVILEELEKIQ